ncbi:MAG: hypothetical protein DRP26_06675, partial [Candidatus Zixiibacteriota bacterium]
MLKRIFTLIVSLTCLNINFVYCSSGGEEIDRGLVALARDRGEVFLSWRLLKSDPEKVGFNVYRRQVWSETQEKLNNKPILNSTNYLDQSAAPGTPYRYQVRPVINGKEAKPSKEFYVRAFPFNIPYIQILLQGNYTARNVAIADLDSDGAYDYIIKQPDFNTDPWREPGYWKRSREP